MKNLKLVLCAQETTATFIMSDKNINFDQIYYSAVVIKRCNICGSLVAVVVGVRDVSGMCPQS